VTVTLPLVTDASGTGATGGIAGLLNRERKIA